MKEKTMLDLQQQSMRMRAIKKIALGPNQLLRNEHIRNAFGNFMMN
jgi:hypothetical protein